MTAYYNEFEPYAAQWLRNLIAAGHIATGEVDERSISDVHADDLKGFTQCHFFAGIGGWSLAARLAGWSDGRPLWTGSCPCQPFSVAGKGKGQADERHLWPVFFDLIKARRPPVVMGEQVAAAVGKSWLDGVFIDLESIGYATGAAVIPACAVNAPHRRDRLWFIADNVANANDKRCRSDGECGGLDEVSRGEFHPRVQAEERNTVSGKSLADTDNTRPQGHGRPVGQHDTQGRQEPDGHSASHSFWHGAEYITGPDGKARRIEPSIRLLAHGVPARVGKLRAYGNAIVPQVAAEIIKSYMECRP